MGSSLFTSSFAGTYLLWFGSFRFGRCFEVGVIKEQGKKDQVAQVHQRTPRYVFHGCLTVLLIHPAVDQTQDGQTHGHLHDLGSSDHHGAGAGHTNAGRLRRIVGVHEGVNCVVHGHEPASACHLVPVGEPGVEQNGDVVVPVEEDEALLPQDNEHRVPWEKSMKKTELFWTETESGYSQDRQTSCWGTAVIGQIFGCYFRLHTSGACSFSLKHHRFCRVNLQQQKYFFFPSVRMKYCRQTQTHRLVSIIDKWTTINQICILQICKITM